MIRGLGRPRNRHILVQLRTARAWGVPVGTIRHGRHPHDWSRLSDRIAAVALTEFEEGLHTCGHPRNEAFDDESDGDYVVKDDLTCYACKARDEWAKETHDMTPGQQTYVVHLRDHPDA